MRIKALALRILNQLRNDKRTLALILCAPLLVLTLIYFILDTTITDIKVGVVNAPQKYVENLYKNNITPVRCTESEAAQLLEDEEIIAYVRMTGGKLYIDLDGGNTTKANAALALWNRRKRVCRQLFRARLPPLRRGRISGRRSIMSTAPEI
jgi:ABC-2 type transport system permease protein